MPSPLYAACIEWLAGAIRLQGQAGQAISRLAANCRTRVEPSGGKKKLPTFFGGGSKGAGGRWGGPPPGANGCP